MYVDSGYWDIVNSWVCVGRGVESVVRRAWRVGSEDPSAGALYIYWRIGCAVRGKEDAQYR